MAIINSESYWSDRFNKDWASRGGRKQSEFFMQIILNRLPGWLSKSLASGHKTVCDWGCAEGEGSEMLASAFPKSSIEGIDFASNAIETARTSHKAANLSFDAVDLLKVKSHKRYEVIVSSNVFEHFNHPWEVFDKVSKYADEVIVMLVPFNEENLIDEHLHRFTEEEFRLRRKNWDIVHFEVIDTSKMPDTYWVGKQALVIFTEQNYTKKLGLSIDEVSIAQQLAPTLEEQVKKLTSENRKLSQNLEDLKESMSQYEAQLFDKSNKLDILDNVIKSEQLKNKKQLQVSGDSGRLGKTLGALPVGAYIKLKKAKNNRELQTQRQFLKDSQFFDEDYYLTIYPDIAKSGADPITHYLLYGYKEGRKPSVLFDQDYYLATNPDVRKQQINPLLHYLTHGKNEQRSPRLNIEIDPEDKRLAIAFQLDSFDKGGLEEVVLMLASNAAINSRHRVYIFVTGKAGGYLAELARSRGIQVIALNNNANYLDYLIGRLEIQLVNLHYSTFGVGIYSRNRTKVVYTVHNNYIWANDQFIAERRRAYQHVDHFIAVSGQVGLYFAEKFGVPLDKISVVTNGINVNDSQTVVPQKREDRELTSNDFVFISVASFTPNKFHSSMIAALGSVVKEHPNAKLLLVGNVIDQNYFASMKKLIDKYKVADNVKIIDYVPKPQLLGLLEIADCFVMSSITEGFSIASLEAMYHKLPMILTDVGGARHCIADQDVGIIINNAYDDLQKLNDEKIRLLYSDDSNLQNLNELVSAMNEMVSHKKEWKAKAKLSRKKVESMFQDKNVVEGYIKNFYDTLTAQSTATLKEVEDIIGQVEIAFIAPYPDKHKVTEGWMSRISAIDAIIGNKKKVYINVIPGYKKISIEKFGKGEWEIKIGSKSPIYSELMNGLTTKLNAIYVHTLHMAEFVLPWLDSKKIIVDIHGITPEEEIMMGQGFLKDKYEVIEERVLAKAKACIMVTEAMKRHYKQKYPYLKPNTIILPVVEEIKPADRKELGKKPSEKFDVVYSGGTQSWQNVEAMLQLTKSGANYANVTFLSNHWHEIKHRGDLLGVPESTKYQYCPKEELFSKYLEFDLGFVLRDDTAVNRVACPTKLYEYMKCGIVPIIRTEKMGDFVEFGYKYVKEHDFLNGQLPSSKEWAEILQNNYEAVSKIKDKFVSGSKALKSIT